MKANRWITDPYQTSQFQLLPARQQYLSQQCPRSRGGCGTRTPVIVGALILFSGALLIWFQWTLWEQRYLPVCSVCPFAPGHAPLCNREASTCISRPVDLLSAKCSLGYVPRLSLLASFLMHLAHATHLSTTISKILIVITTGGFRVLMMFLIGIIYAIA